MVAIFFLNQQTKMEKFGRLDVEIPLLSISKIVTSEHRDYFGNFSFDGRDYTILQGYKFCLWRIWREYQTVAKLIHAKFGYEFLDYPIDFPIKDSIQLNFLYLRLDSLVRY